MVLYYLIIGLVVYALFLCLIYFYVEKIVFRPTPISPDFTYKFNANFEEVFLQDDQSDLKINAIHFKSPNPKGCILYFHGNTGSLDRWGAAHEEFTTRGYDTFMIDYPGYGKSSHTRTEKNVYQSAKMAYSWVAHRFLVEDIIVFGCSIGSGPASYVAQRNPAQQLILQTPFYSMDQLLKHFAPFIFYLIPPKVALRVDQQITQLKMPITIIHGTDDKIVPYSSAVKLKEVIKSTDRFLTIQGGGHNNIMGYVEVQQELNRSLGLR